MLLHADLTDKIISSAVKVHCFLGPGLLESAYDACLAHELAKQGHAIERQLPIPIRYDGTSLDCGFRADLIINRAVIVEIKFVDKLHPVHEAQLMTYLRLSSIKVGLLINFNQLRVTDNLIRRVL